MALNIERKLSPNAEKIYVYDPKDKKNKHLAYEINTNKRLIIFYPKNPIYLTKLELHNFTKLPSEFNEKGYVKSGTFYYLDKKAKEIKCKTVKIDAKLKSKISSKGRGKIAIISYNDFQTLKSKLSHLNYSHKINKSNLVDDYFYSIFPNYFKKKDKLVAKRTSEILNNLDDSLIKELKPSESEKMMQFFEKLLKSRYKTSLNQNDLFHSTKIKIDNIAISKIINEYEQMLSKNLSEEVWSNYLEKNLFLLDSKYVKIIPQLNVILVTCRKVDFGLVDTQGYLDLFEIKKPKTKLLSFKTDRGNYYWSVDATKAIVQAEKYLFNAENKGPSLAQDLKREKDMDVDVVRPRALLIIGTSKQFVNKKMRDDFRVLRRSLKNIEIILYDELLDRIKAQKNKVYVN